MAFYAVVFISTAIFFTAGIFLYALSSSFFENLALSPLLSYFYRASFVSLFIAFLLITLFKAVVSLLLPNADAAPLKKPIPLYVLLLLVVIGTIYSASSSAGPVLNGIEKEYSRITEAAEGYRSEDRLYLCGSAYKEAYALTQAFQAYLVSQQAMNKEDYPEAVRSEAHNRSAQLMKTAYEFWPDGAQIHYLDALRQEASAPAGGIPLLEKAGALDPDFTYSHFLLLDLYKSNNAKDKAGGITDILIRGEAFTQPAKPENLSGKTIEELIEKYKKYEKFCLENIATSAVFYYENRLYQEAMNELNKLVQVLPDDLAVNYMIAMTDLEMKADNKKYTAALDAVEKIRKMYPGEEWADELATGVAMRAGNQEMLESSLQEAYGKSPGNLDIAEQYAYSLLKKNTQAVQSAYNDTVKQAEAIIDDILARDGSRWFSLYCKSVIQLFKKEYESSMASFGRFSDIISGDPGRHDIFDEFSNLYILKYRECMLTDPKAAELLASREASNPLLFNYANGAYYWKQTDYDSSEKHLKAVIGLRPDLSKPYFFLGSVYFEKAGVNNLPDYFPKAEEEYRKALAIFPEDPYGWFSLGHVLKRLNRLEDAMGAFQKTLAYMPSEDHAIDHYGISIHSTYQIQEIQGLLKSGGGQ